MRILLTKISFMMIITSFVFLLAVGFVTFFGMNIGDFVVSINDETEGYLALSETGDFKEDITGSLKAVGLDEATNTTYGYIPKDITKGHGSKNDEEGKTYIAYSFFVKNISNIAVDYNATITIEDFTKNVDEAVRVMVIKENEDGKTEKIYAKPTKEGKPETHLEPSVDSAEPYITEMFKAPTIVTNTLNLDFSMGDIDKFTVVIWLEGEDEQCVDEIKGGSIKMSMKFSVEKNENE